MLFEPANRIHAGHTIDRAHQRRDHPVLHGAKIRRFGNLALEPVAAFGDEAAIGLPACPPTGRSASTSGIFVFDGIHQHFAETGGDRPHRGLCALGQRRTDWREPLIDLLPGEVEVGALLEDRGNLAEAVARNRSCHLQAFDPGKSGFDGEGHLRLDLRR